MRRNMTTHERLLLPTWLKWRYFGKIPWKIIVNLMLVALTTSVVTIVNLQDGQSFRALDESFRYLFFPSSYDFSTPDWYLYSIDDVKSALHQATTNYYNITEVAIDKYILLEDAHGNLRTPSLKVTTFVHPNTLFNPNIDYNDEEETNYYALTPDDLGPLATNNQTELAMFFHRLRKMELRLTLEHWSFTDLTRTCLVWDVDIIYSFEARGRLLVTLQRQVRDQCLGVSTSYKDWMLAARWFIIIFAASYFVLLLRSLVRSAALVRRLLLRYRQKQTVADYVPTAAVGRHDSVDSSSMLHTPLIPTRVQLKFEQLDAPGAELKWVNWWSVLGLVSCILCIASSAMFIHSDTVHLPTSFGMALFDALGTALLWVELLRYLDYDQSYFTVVLTLRRGLPKVLRFLFGVAPVFMGYAVFAVVNFGSDIPRFGNFQDTLVTLFAVLNGDVIRETYMTLMPRHPITGQLFMYSFITLFIYVVLNCFIAIIEESFFQVSKRVIQEAEKEGMFRGNPGDTGRLTNQLNPVADLSREASHMTNMSGMSGMSGVSGS